MKKTTLSILAAALAATGIQADDAQPKRTFKNNGMEVYRQLPGTADSFKEIFEKGMVYGRLRLNSFYWDRTDEDDTYKDSVKDKEGKTIDPTGFAVGGSLIYKTAALNGFSGTVGFYTAHSLGLLEEEDVQAGKSGKDTFSRYKNADGGYEARPLNVLAQSYVQYVCPTGMTTVKAGRQIVESFMIKSNDTKMAPNTFEGYTVTNTAIPATTLRLGWLLRQKLRDHQEFHDVIAYDGWNHNDDAGVHKGLTKARLDAEGVDTSLLLAEATVTPVPGLKLDLSYTAVPDLFSTAMAEANFDVKAGGWTFSPGVRYLAQADDGGGEIGGAALSGSATGYDDPTDLSTSMTAARIVVKKGAGKFLLGTSAVADDADIIAPWRGFPTAGYTRPMAQYNWTANTKSTMVQAFYDFGKAGVIPNFRMTLDYVTNDRDEEKNQADNSQIHTDMWYRFSKEFEGKIRVAANDGEAESRYNEYRFELNYLF